MNQKKSLMTILMALAAIVAMTWAMTEFTGGAGWPGDQKKSPAAEGEPSAK